jgi:putative ABC transport system ATP-binding protein
MTATTTPRSISVDPSGSAIQGVPPIQPAVRIRALNYWYGSGANKTHALADVDVKIDRGEVAILTGPSGSGKTTLLTLIGALRQVDNGDVHVLGRDLRRLEPSGQVAVRRDVGFIFQFHNLFDSLTAIENVRMATALKPAPVAELNRRAEEILARLGMADQMDRLPSELSGGQKQRVAIARALVNQPALVLADEPTASLDPASGQEMLTILHELASGPNMTAVLIVTHDHRVLDRADRIINLVSGRVVSNVRTDRSLKIVALLGRLPIFAKLSFSTLTRIAERVTAESKPAGEVIVREGEPGDRKYLIQEGTAEATAAGKPSRLLAIGDDFGEITELTGTPIHETVRARTPMELFVLARDGLQEVVRSDNCIDDHVHIHSSDAP